jgi:hypothetical protein
MVSIHMGKMPETPHTSQVSPVKGSAIALDQRRIMVVMLGTHLLCNIILFRRGPATRNHATKRSRVWGVRCTSGVAAAVVRPKRSLRYQHAVCQSSSSGNTGIFSVKTFIYSSSSSSHSHRSPFPSDPQIMADHGSDCQLSDQRCQTYQMNHNRYLKPE